MKKIASLKCRDYVRETLSEYQRKGHFLRIYTSKNSEIYDCFFIGSRPINKFIYKILYTDEIMKCNQKVPKDMKIGCKIDIPGSYE
jgi:hypothetical protein